MIIKNWNILGLTRNKSDDLVTEAHWKLTGTDNEHSYSMNGTVHLERGNSFVEFSELTEEVIVGWVKEKLGEEVAILETNVEFFVNKQKEETTTVDGLPW
jgi:hypothetical protein